MAFIAAHPHSFVSAYTLYYYSTRIPIDSVKMLYEGFDSKVRNSFSGKIIANILGGQPGVMAKSFITTDINGNPLSLSSFKGINYVLLDFWARLVLSLSGK